MNPVTCVMTILMMVVVMVAADPIHSYRRVKRQFDLPTSSSSASDSDECEAKYAAMDHHTLCQPIDETAQLVELNDSTISFIVNKHNYYRANVDPPAADMLKMVWDETLARTARRAAMRCILHHDHNRREPDWRGIEMGQNLAFGHKSWDIALYRLFSEPERANYSYGDNYTNGIGHWFQMASNQTNRVGCGQAFCPNTIYKHHRACNYALRMNVGTDDQRPPYTAAAQSCSSCKENCENNLCNCGNKLCFNKGKLDHGTCKCSCPYGWTGTDCSKVDCSAKDKLNSCTNGKYSYADCSQPGTKVRDPYMCPHLCQICPPCDGKQCKNGGALDKSCKCNCSPSYTGSLCETACSTITCQNGGTLNACKCECTNQYYGRFCENKCPACQNGGTLTKDSNGNCKCTCAGDFYGAQCQELCANNPEYENNQICGLTNLCPYVWMREHCKKSCGACQAA